jgi:hypothetical protein
LQLSQPQQPQHHQPQQPQQFEQRHQFSILQRPQQQSVDREYEQEQVKKEYEHSTSGSTLNWEAVEHGQWFDETRAVSNMNTNNDYYFSTAASTSSNTNDNITFDVSGYHGSESSETTATSSTSISSTAPAVPSADEFVISPGERSNFDGYSRWKSPSGQTFVTAAGQSVELWAGVHCGSSLESTCVSAACVSVI